MNDYEAIILYVYLCVPMASIQMTAMTQGNYTKVLRREVFALRREAFTHRSFYTETFLHRGAFTH